MKKYLSAVRIALLDAQFSHAQIDSILDIPRSIQLVNEFFATNENPERAASEIVSIMGIRYN